MSSRLAVAKTYKLYINGSFPRSESGRSVEVHGSDDRVLAHVSRASRKDLRDAIEAAVVAQPKWAGASAYNRGQVLYRMAEMLEGKRDEFIALLMETRAARRSTKASRRGNQPASKARRATLAVSRASALRELYASIDRLVCFAGWADKYAQVLGCNNPVSGPYYNFTVPEPTGVVAVVWASDGMGRAGPPLLGLISLIAPPLCAGNAVVAVADGSAMLPAAVLGEVCATSDVPAGALNILTGQVSELAEHIAGHRAVNAISAANVPPDIATILKLGAAENLKRVRIQALRDDEAWHDDDARHSPWTIEPFVEMKTIWHPAAT